MAEEDVISQRQTIDDGMVIKLDGEIDLMRSPQLRNELMHIVKDGVPRLVIDLTEVPFMDSSGVATLVEISIVKDFLPSRTVWREVR